MKLLKTFFVKKSGLWVRGVVDFDQGKVDEVADVVLVKGPLVLRDVGGNHGLVDKFYMLSQLAFLAFPNCFSAQLRCLILKKN